MVACAVHVITRAQTVEDGWMIFRPYRSALQGHLSGRPSTIDRDRAQPGTPPCGMRKTHGVRDGRLTGASECDRKEGAFGGHRLTVRNRRLAADRNNPQRDRPTDERRSAGPSDRTAEMDRPREETNEGRCNWRERVEQF
jgi:hypothetical protein